MIEVRKVNHKYIPHRALVKTTRLPERPTKLSDRSVHPVIVVSETNADKLKTMKYFFIVLVLLNFLASELAACTTFCLKDGAQIVFGRNYDWDVETGMLMVNKRSVSKTAMLQKFEKPAQWISKYGSLTFNQYGREFPTGGINEAGLVVELMMLQEGVYPPVDNRPVVGGLEWIQYQLDRSSTIDEVIQNASGIRISSMVKLHFLVCDRLGGCVTVEFLDGAFVPHSGLSLPVAVLTNDTFAKSMEYLKTLAGFGGTGMPSPGPGSLERFGRAATMMKQYRSGQGAVKYAFQMLANVANGGYTKWSIVYDITNLRIYFRTSSSPQLKYLDLPQVNFTCKTSAEILDMNSIEPGNVSKSLRKYTSRINRELVRQSYLQTTFLAGTPASQIEVVARHPETFACVPE